MILSDLPAAEAVRRFSDQGLVLRTGPFSVRIRSRLSEIHQGFLTLYADYPVEEDGGFTDIQVSLDLVSGLRRWYRPQIEFRLDGWVPFKSLPRNQAMAMIEWGLNWCIHSSANQFLILHAAAIEKDGFAAILPAPPGSGKSTLCAGLIHRGWRLLSDELALVSMRGDSVTPLARPVSLKNRSIEAIRAFAPDSVLSEPVPDTLKGTICMMKAPVDSVRRKQDPAVPAWIVFPRYEEGAPAQLTPRPKGRTCLEVGTNAINYSLLGIGGFEALTRMVDGCGCYDFVYGSLDEAEKVFAALEPPA